MTRLKENSLALGENLGDAVKCRQCAVLREQLEITRQQNERFLDLILKDAPADEGFPESETAPQRVGRTLSRTARYRRLEQARRQELNDLLESKNT